MKWNIKQVEDNSDYHFITCAKNGHAIDQCFPCQRADIYPHPLHRGINQQWRILEVPMLSTLINRLSPVQRLYDSFIACRNRHQIGDLALGDFNKLVNFSDVFVQILSCISMRDMAILRQLCQHMKELLPTYHLQKFHVPTIQGAYDDQDQLFYTGPVITRHLHRLYINLKWSDQGWGNMKTRLMFYLKRGGKVVANWNIHALHEVREYAIILEDNNIVGLSQPGDQIEVWRHVGGGGGHVMHIKNFTLLFEILS